ncbi:tetratricopeptide repeat protein [Roseivirga sp. BDSF3-8]|uniref:tetratricopeptide repeat protein n=1 Tax=Roseivirga sp. BDSF3-8 TaxID=3241598 RepID=UPI0035318EAA
MRLKVILSTVVAFMMLQNVQAQNGWNWPEDEKLRKEAETKNVLYSDHLRNDNYKAAKAPLVWLLKNTPDLNASIYINGAKIYEALEAEASSEEEKFVLQDSALLMYDLRIKYFNDKSNVMNRKAYTAYKFYKDRQDKYPELYSIQKENFDLNKEETHLNNFIGYMDAIRRYKATGGEITDEEVIQVYDEVNEALKAKGGHEKIQEGVDKIFAATVDIDCDLIENKLGPRFLEDTSNIDLATNIIKLSFVGKCLDSEVFLQAAEVVHRNAPEYALAKLIAVKALQADDYDKAEEYFKEAISLTEDNTKKADIYVSMAEMSAKRGRKSDARSYAMDAVEADPSKREAYNLIGTLYFNSFDACKGGQSRVQDRAVFLAAYDMYRKAGNSQGMANAKAQFPSKEEVFTENMQVGQSISVGCWIGTTVSLQTRD